MRVALDATPLLGARTGVGVFAAHLLEALAGRGTDLRPFALTWRGRDALPAQLPPGLRLPALPMAARPLRALWKRLDVPRIEWWTGPVDVVHGTNFVVPPSRWARVVTVHDLTCVRFPELCTRDTREYPRLVRRAIARGAFVHTPSAFVREEVIAELGAPPERVRAIHHGVPAGPPPSASAAPSRPWPYVLALGTVEPRKNLPLLVAAFDDLAAAHPDLRLVIAGPDGWGSEALAAAVAAAHHRDRIERTGYVPDERRWSLVAGASVYAYPSVYEGFGLPPLEAMAQGVPVVATAAGSLPEVVGDAALLVAPEREALASALASVVDDTGLRSRLVAAGRARVAGFSWERCAAEMLALYGDARGAL